MSRFDMAAAGAVIGVVAASFCLAAAGATAGAAAAIVVGLDPGACAAFGAILGGVVGAAGGAAGGGIQGRRERLPPGSSRSHWECIWSWAGGSPRWSGPLSSHSWRSAR